MMVAERRASAGRRGRVQLGEEQENTRRVEMEGVEKNNNNSRSPSGGCVLNDYEVERARRIAANQARMRELGLGSGVLIGVGAEYDGYDPANYYVPGAHEFVRSRYRHPSPHQKLELYQRTTEKSTNMIYYIKNNDFWPFFFPPS